MSGPALAIYNAGLVTSVGLSTAASCAALRAGVSNPSQTRVKGQDGLRITAHRVEAVQAETEASRLVQMAALAVAECLEGLDDQARAGLPVLLCVAEAERPGRLAGLEQDLFAALQDAVGFRFHAQHVAVAAVGRPGVLLALAHARALVAAHQLPRVLIVAVDSLVRDATLQGYDQHDRLLRDRHSNGFIAGEGAGAILVGPAKHVPGELLCMGLGAALEPADLLSGAPLRSDGLTSAIKQALAEAGCAMSDLDFRITDLSGEQYFFKEASLALSRTMRTVKSEFDLWHPAECFGECGAVAGAAMLATAWQASRKGYAPGPHILLHAAADTQRRAAAILKWTGRA